MEWIVPCVHNHAFVSGRPWSRWAQISTQAGLMESACRSPARLTNASASSRAVFSDSDRGFVDCSIFGALNTVGKSHVGMARGRGGFSILAPLRKRTDELYLPTDWPAIGAWKACYEHLKCGRGTSFNAAAPAGRTEPLITQR